MVYYIENTIDEEHKKIQGYFETLESAIEVCTKYCSDWLRENGTGEIYEVYFGLNQERRLVWKDGKRLT